jgi:hypothetical protein
MNTQNKQLLFVLPFGLPFDWSADYEQQTAKYLALNNVVIMFLVGEGINIFKYMFRRSPLFVRQSKLCYIFRPLYILPFQRFSIIRRLNYYLAGIQLKILIRSRKQWRLMRKCFYSFSLQESVSPNWFTKEYFHVYDCMDAFVSNDKRTNIRWGAIDATLTNSADIIITVSTSLYKTKRPKHPHVYYIPVGFDEYVMRQSSGVPEPIWLKHIPHPRICMVGNISSRLDFRFLRTLISATPNYSYILVGKIDPNYITYPVKNFTLEIQTLQSFRNVFFIPSKPRRDVARILQYIDIGIIPYDMTEPFTKYSFPMKLWEYFYYGKPVIATDNKDLHKYVPYVQTVHNNKEAVKALSTLTKRVWSTPNKNKQKSIALNNSWQKRTEKILMLVTKHIEKNTIVI